MRKITLALIAGLLILSIVSCTRSETTTTSKATTQDTLEKIYNADPYRQYIGTEVENHKFTDVITGNTFEIKDFANKVIIFESFSVGCPACAAGIKNYNYIYDKYKDKVTIIYLNINPYDTEENIIGIKKQYNGKDWIWVKFDENLKPFLDKYDLIGNDITYIIKDSKVVYADSLSAPISRVENALVKVI